ncbi:hypothetical protein D5278_21660, partial [bacterium 1XD21-13]|nr:hypothetical protein [bacterium 1XD21-13]
NVDSTTIAQLTELVIRQSRQIEQLVAIREEQGNSSTNVTRDHGDERFHRLRPPTFNGRVSDPVYAEEWIRKMEDMFKYAKVDEGDKVNYAVFHVELDARHWWDSIQSTIGAGPMTWEMFKAAFFDKYFNRTVRASKKKEFMGLRQTGSVTDYICKFEALSRFAPRLVEDDEDKIHQFVQGLKPSLFMRVKTAGIHNVPFGEVTAKALELEEAEITTYVQREQPRKFTKEAQPPPRQNRGWQPQQDQRPPQQQGIKRPFNPNDD